MMQVSNNKKFESYEYKSISVLSHYETITLLNILLLISLGIGLYREYPWEWLALGILVMLLANLHWWLRLKKENGFPSFEVDELGIIVNEAGGVHIFHWEELDSVKRYGP